MESTERTRKFTADLTLLPDGMLHSGVTVAVNQEGIVVGIGYDELETGRKLNGILTPGFINSHCHLELSYLKERINSGTGLPQFIHDIIEIRKSVNRSAVDAILDADLQMWLNGIQAVGDICNSSDGMDCKSKSKIKYHNLVEVFGLSSNQATERMNAARSLFEKSRSLNMRASVVPHAPYTVTQNLFQGIAAAYDGDSGIWSIHHCESLSEKEFVKNGSGPFRNMFVNSGLIGESFDGYGMSVTKFIASHFPESGKILLVHNTYMDRDDVLFLKGTGRFDDIYFCLCPNANLYIEGRLPDIPMMIAEGCKLVLGTDSLASNHSLSIYDEIGTIRAVFPELPLHSLLQWATANAASLFGWTELGQIAMGKSPGWVFISGNQISRLV